MLRLALPTDEVEYLQLAFPAAGPGLVVRWGTQLDPYTVATWDGGDAPGWQLVGRHMHLSPDGEWVSDYDKDAGLVTVTRVGAGEPTAVVVRGKGIDNVWTAVAPGGSAVAWIEGRVTIVRALPGGKPVARIKSGWAYDLRFAAGGRWLTEVGEQVFRVFDREQNYKPYARIPAPRHVLAAAADGPTAIVDDPDRGVAVWDLSTKLVKAHLSAGRSVHSLAISPDGRRVLTGSPRTGVTLWDAAGERLRRYDWGVKSPIAVAFARDGTRAAVGGTDGQVVVWDLDE